MDENTMVHAWKPVDFVPVAGTDFVESFFECVWCHERRTSKEMERLQKDQHCRWANLDLDEPITLPDDPRLAIRVNQ